MAQVETVGAAVAAALAVVAAVVVEAARRAELAAPELLEYLERPLVLAETLVDRREPEAPEALGGLPSVVVLVA